MKEKNATYSCLVCGKYYSLKNLTPMGTVRKVITEEIAKDIPDWSPDHYICQTDLTKYRVLDCHHSPRQISSILGLPPLS